MRREVFPPEGKRVPLARRSANRLPFALLAHVRVGAGAWTRATLTELSTGGFRLGWYRHEVRVGQTVMIRIPGLQLLVATVRHCGAEGIGCEFARPLSDYVVEHLARSAR